MIRFILLQNRQGKTRLSKWYVPFNASEKFKIESEIHRAVVTRDPRNTNKIIYRRYAGMFFIFCVDMNDNELGILELIHLFVEVLDGYFGNVCELDLVFHFDKVYRILDELLLAGEVSETSTSKIIAIMKSVDKMD